MSKLILGSIDLNKINKNDIQTVNKNGEPFKNGAKYLNITVWINDEPDDYGNDVAIKAGDKENSYYIGNAKTWKKEGQQQQAQPQKIPTEAELDMEDDLPF